MKILSMTKHQDPCTQDNCPVRLAADLLEHKWITLIIRDLLTGKKRFSELERSLRPISAKVLTARLKELEQNELITRYVYASVPPTTEYELNDSALELRNIILAMEALGNRLLRQTQGD